MVMIGYDPDRVRRLRVATRLAIGELAQVRSDDPAAGSAMAVVRRARLELERAWMPVIDRVLASDAMLWFTAIGLHPFVGATALGLVRGLGAAARSRSDEALGVLLSDFDRLDADGDGELSADELTAGARHGDRAVSAACTYLLAHPLVVVNAALSEERFSWHENSGVDAADVVLTTSSIATALTQNRVVRVLGDPKLFAELDRAVTGKIDGRVSGGDVEAWLERERDPEIRAALQYLLDDGLLGRLDRDGIFAGSDGRITYDQVYALGVHQGAFDGLPDPTIPPGLRHLYGEPEDTGDRTPQFLHHVIPAQPGLGQVVIVLYIATPTAGMPGGDYGKSTGNDRGPDPRAHPSDSKGWAVIDYETGIVTVRVNPSCSAENDGACRNPLPITTDFGSAGSVLQRVPLVVDDTNRVLVDSDGERTKVRFGILNSDKRVVAPRIDATFEVAANPEGTVTIEWHRDAYPSLEAYHIHTDGEIVRLAAEEAAHNAERGLAPFWWTNTHGTGRG